MSSDDDRNNVEGVGSLVFGLVLFSPFVVLDEHAAGFGIVDITKARETKGDSTGGCACNCQRVVVFGKAVGAAGVVFLADGAMNGVDDSLALAGDHLSVGEGGGVLDGFVEGGFHLMY